MPHTCNWQVLWTDRRADRAHRSLYKEGKKGVTLLKEAFGKKKIRDCLAAVVKAKDYMRYGARLNMPQSDASDGGNRQKDKFV